jgi:hypothetical protein
MTDPRLLSKEQLAIYLEYDTPKPIHIAQLLDHIDALDEALDAERAKVAREGKTGPSATGGAVTNVTLYPAGPDPRLVRDDWVRPTWW